MLRTFASPLGIETEASDTLEYISIFSASGAVYVTLHAFHTRFGRRSSAICSVHVVNCMVSGCADTTPHSGTEGGFRKSADRYVRLFRPKSAQMASSAF